MKSIEERAKEYSLKDFDGYYTGWEKAVEEGYIAGATWDVLARSWTT